MTLDCTDRGGMSPEEAELDPPSNAGARDAVHAVGARHREEAFTQQGNRRIARLRQPPPLDACGAERRMCE